MIDKKITIVLVALGLVGCTLFHASKTPKGIDVNPIYSFSINHDVPENKLDTIKKYVPSNATYRAMWGSDTFIFSAPQSQRKEAAEFRQVEISRYKSLDAASARYREDKKVFSQSSWKIYKDVGDRENRYFSAYKSPWLDS